MKKILLLVLLALAVFAHDVTTASRLLKNGNK